MKLRTKLIATFGTTLVLSILVFGAITYLSFAKDRVGDKEEILRLQDEAVLLRIESKIERELNALLLASREGGPGENALMRLVEISDWPSTTAPIQSLTHFQKLALALSRPLLHREEGHDYLLWPQSESGRSRQLVVTEFSRNGLRTLLEQSFQVDQALLQVRQGNDVLYVFDHLDPSSGDHLDAARDFLNQSTPEKGRLLAGGFFSLYVPDRNTLGLQFRYLVPKAGLLKSAIVFKNRIVTALILLSWVAVWVVLILAYRITRPLGVLDQAARDIISYHYETPLEFRGGSREVRSLAASFETMRRKIKDLVIHDSLTGLYNRRYLMHALELTVARAERGEGPLACLMMDMDHFKAINDQYGHGGGDTVLSEFGRILRAMSRNYDLAARYGGEEFTLILPGTNLPTALQVGDRLRQAVASHSFFFKGSGIDCTISIGVACLEPEGDTPERLLDRADRALYAAKHQGRNRIVHL